MQVSIYEGKESEKKANKSIKRQEKEVQDCYKEKNKTVKFSYTSFRKHFVL